MHIIYVLLAQGEVRRVVVAALFFQERSESSYYPSVSCHKSLLLTSHPSPSIPLLCVFVTQVVSNSLWAPGLWPTRLLCPWNSPGKSNRVGCHFFLHGIFLTQGSNPGLLHCRQILYFLSCLGNSYLSY